MTIKTTTEQLIAVQAAIDAIVTGAQEYQINSGTSERRLVRAPLEALLKREDYLLAKLNKENNGGMRVQRVVLP